MNTDAPTTPADIAFDTGDGPATLTAPQRMGTVLWKPMQAMALTGFVVALALAFVRSAMISDADPTDADTIEALRHVLTGSMFLGFTGVFAAISFAIARILGVFRVGASEVQADVAADVLTMRMPATGRAFITLMGLGMMTLATASVLHLIVGITVPSAAEADLVTSEKWFLFLEGTRRIGAGLYLLGIALGLATIIQVIRFQAIRIRQLAAATD